MYGIALIGPNIEYTKGIPSATELPKQEPSPKRAQLSDAKFKYFLLM